MLKYASAQIMTADLAPRNASRRELKRFAHRHHFDYEVRPGYLYVRSRAISSRCNDNFDEFPAEELEKAYATFKGKPVFVNHVNDDHRRARGVIIDAALHKDSNRDGSKDWWVEVLMEVDANRFPRLAKEILAGNIARTSMGCDVAFSKCSACGNKATSPAEYCAHIPASKGMMLYRTTASGRKVGEIIRETCYGLKFFENSLLVEPPADPTAHFLGVDTRGLQSTAMKKGAPFADYKDFEQCTEENSDKGDPEAYCGEIKHRTEDKKTSAKDPRFAEVGMGVDEDGHYVKTHRARSKSYPTPDDIPQSVVDRIAATGKRVTRIDLRAIAARKTAYGEQKAPMDVDTLREDACPVCGDRDTFDGAMCQVCGYVAPPKMFQDPDLEKARQMDLRKDIAEFQDPMNPNQIGPDGNPVDPAAMGQDPMDPSALGPDGQPLDPTAEDPSMQPGGLPGEVQAEVQPDDGSPMDPVQQAGGQIPEELGAPVDPAMLGPDGQPLQQPGQQMTLPDGTPIGPQVLPDAATTNMGQPFTPGPNMPQGPGEPDGPASPEDLDEDGQPLNPDAGQGAPGTPMDGVPDLMCPNCGFTADASMPTSVDMDTQTMPNMGAAQMDGTQAGDVCPNCGSAQLLSPAEVQGQTDVPMPV